MSRIKAPPEKKRAEYGRDHRTAMDAAHAFRKSRPKKKARINREHRRAADSAVDSVLRGADPDALVLPKQVSGWALSKVGVQTLGEKVADTQVRKQTQFLPFYTHEPYVRQRHAARFKRFLASLLVGSSALAAKRATYLRRLIESDLPNNADDLSAARWVRAFLSDQPAWSERVGVWIRQERVGVGAKRRTTLR